MTDRCERCGRERWSTGPTHPGLCMKPGGADCVLVALHYERGRRAGMREAIEAIRRTRALVFLSNADGFVPVPEDCWIAWDDFDAEIKRRLGE